MTLIAKSEAISRCNKKRQTTFCLGDVLPIGQMVINRIADLRRIGGLRHRFDTEQPTLLDLEVINRASGERARDHITEQFSRCHWLVDFIVEAGGRGGNSTVVAFSLHTQQPWIRILTLLLAPKSKLSCLEK